MLNGGVNQNIAKVYLHPRRAGPSIGQHPWVFAGVISHVDPTVEDGGLVSVHKSEDQSFIAYGLFNSKSQIRIRLYSWNEEEVPTAEWFKKKVSESIKHRLQILNYRKTASFRAVFSESDGLSGLVVDKFGDYLSVQISSLALHRFLEPILEVLENEFKPKAIRVRPDRSTVQVEGFDFEAFWKGQEPDSAFLVQEGAIQYWVDLRSGQKTGAYLDQTLNRQRVAELAKNRKVLDLYCYAGGFGLQAAHAGAVEVLGIDSSNAAIALAKNNAELNKLTQIRFLESDVSKALESMEPASFDMVIVDPPRLSASRSSHEQALRKYFSINLQALQVLKPGGIFVSCSCSGLVTTDEFLSTLADATRKLRRTLKIIEVRGPGPDHPISLACPETAYLKCVIGVLQ